MVMVLAAACVPASAGWFSKGQPVPDWAVQAAKTPTPAPAVVKDAAAVVLYDENVETIDANGRATERHREVRRILKPQGRHSSCDVSYDVDNKVNYFRAWTITADEKNTFEAQPTDFIEEGDTDVPIMLSTRKTRYARPPAIDVGATLVCESEELMAPYDQETIWLVQRNVPVVFQALEVDLSAGHSHSEAWHRFDPVKPAEIAPNHWRWELKDVPALNLRDVPSSPEWFALAGRMSVQWGDAAIAEKDQEWRALGEWVTKLEQDRPTPSPEITAKVNELIAGAPDFYTKLSRITEDIRRRIFATSLCRVASVVSRPITRRISIATATATARTRPRW